MPCFWTLNRPVQQKRSTILCLSYFYEIFSNNYYIFVWFVPPAPDAPVVEVEGEDGQGRREGNQGDRHAVVQT